MPSLEPPTTESNLEAVRHTLAHLLAMAVLKKFPKAKLGIGPVIESGFYYDFKLPKPLVVSDLPELEATMRELVAATLPVKGKKLRRPAQSDFSKTSRLNSILSRNLPRESSN